MAIVGLLVQTVLLLVHQPPTILDLAPSAAIHHAHHDGGVPSPPGKAPAKGLAQHCPLCFRLELAGTFLPPEAPALVVPVLLAAPVELGTGTEPLLAAATWSGARPRAPPSLV